MPPDDVVLHGWPHPHPPSIGRFKALRPVVEVEEWAWGDGWAIRETSSSCNSRGGGGGAGSSGDRSHAASLSPDRASHMPPAMSGIVECMCFGEYEWQAKSEEEQGDGRRG